MAVMDILRGAQNGEFFANAGRAAGVDAAEAERRLGTLAPAIVLELRKRAEDPQAFEDILDLLDGGNGDVFLDDASLIYDPEIVDDGKAVLADLYGSATQAHKALAIRADDAAAQRLAAIGASAVLAALARSYRQPLGLTAAAEAAGDAGQGGILSTIVDALIKGAVQGAKRQITPRRRRRRTTSYFGTHKKRPRRRRRGKAPSLEQIFGELLGTLRL
ncbi:MAG: DUF937 domain-containing protein [Parvibaculaceae bacterium]